MYRLSFHLLHCVVRSSSMWYVEHTNQLQINNKQSVVYRHSLALFPTIYYDLARHYHLSFTVKQTHNTLLLCALLPLSASETRRDLNAQHIRKSGIQTYTRGCRERRRLVSPPSPIINKTYDLMTFSISSVGRTWQPQSRSSMLACLCFPRYVGGRV